MTDFDSVNNNLPDPLKSSLSYFNLSNQLKNDIEQQNAIKMQQLEAIRLIQVSLEKLTATTTVPLHNQTTRAAKNPKTPPPTILVYKETSLHKNLLVSKILNKAKYFYYQSIVQTMRLSLMSKLNYYSTLIQQLYPNNLANNYNNTDASRLTDSLNKNLDNSSFNNNNNDTSNDKSSNVHETNLIDEMKLLMQQILHDTYQFNSLYSSNLTSDAGSNSDSLIELTENSNTVNNPKVLKECSPSDLNKPTEKNNENVDKPVLDTADDNEDIEDQQKRIKQLNDVKHSLYALLFPAQSHSTENGSNNNNNNNTTDATDLIQPQITTQATLNSNRLISQNEENVAKRKFDCALEDTNDAKRSRNYCSIDSNNNHVILGDDTNVISHRTNNMNNKISNRKMNSNHNKSDRHKKRLKQHISTNLLKLSLKTATKTETIVNQPDSFINLEVLV